MNAPLNLICTIVTVALLSGFVNIGCGGGLGGDDDIRAFCQKHISCGWNPDTIDWCVDQWEEARDYAEEVGCQDEFNYYTSCVISGSCEDFLDETNACANSYDMWAACIGKTD